MKGGIGIVGEVCIHNLRSGFPIREPQAYLRLPSGSSSYYRERMGSLSTVWYRIDARLRRDNTS